MSYPNKQIIDLIYFMYIACHKNKQLLLFLKMALLWYLQHKDDPFRKPSFSQRILVVTSKPQKYFTTTHENFWPQKFSELR